MVDPDLAPIVIDNGSRVVKCGIAGDDAPMKVFPSVIGRPNKLGVEGGLKEKDIYVGNDAHSRYENLDLSHPVEDGIIVDWDGFEQIIHHSFQINKDLRLKPEEHPILILEPPLNPRNVREKLTTLMFETFKVPAFMLRIQAIMSLYSSGRTTGTVFDSGACVTFSVPVYEGYKLCRGIQRLKIGGNDVTNYLGKLISEQGYEMKSFKEKLLLKEMKEKHGYVALDFENQLIAAETGSDPSLIKEFELPDKSKISLGTERFQATEFLFRPSMLEDSENLVGIDEAIWTSIIKCDVGLRKDMYQNLVLSGGNNLFEGMAERIQVEVTKRAPRNARVKVNDTKQKFSAFVGASIFGSLSTTQNLWIVKEEYDDAGASIVDRKCF